MNMCHCHWDQMGPITTQFTMTTLEELGLSEDGLPGASNADGDTGCSPAGRSRVLVRKLILMQIDYDDKAVSGILSVPAKTDGVFQLESGGMKSFMKELKPQNLEDIIAGISLYRPGPMDFIPQYIKGKE